MNLFISRWRSVLMLMVFCWIFTAAHSQTSCDVSNAKINYICLYNSYAVGVFTTAGSTYTWYLNGVKKVGPVAGNGGAISFSYNIDYTTDAGQYTVKKTTPGFPDTCVYNEVVVINEPPAGLQTTAITANSVSFSWTSTGRCLYYVSPDPTPDYTGANTDTSINGSGTFSGLSGGTTYYIHVNSDCGPYDWATLEFTTPPGPCNVYTNQTRVLGGGPLCLGSSVNLEVTKTRFDQQYTWLRNGTAISGPFTGNGGSLYYPFNFTSLGQAGIYKVRVSKAGCSSADIGDKNVSSIVPITGLAASLVTEVTAAFSWNASGEFGYDYGVTTTSTPPASPYSTSDTNTNTVVEDLNPSSNYYFHVRPKCNSGGPVAWTTIPFSTHAIAPINCSVITQVQNCSSVIASIPAGAGPWNLDGTYPYNSVGVPTKGKELLYSFTPSSTGVYYIDVTAVSGTAISYFYKPNGTTACSNTGWIGMRNNFSAEKFSIGMLQAGVSYLILLDASGTIGASQTFRICKATVGAPSVFNSCINTVSSPMHPPYSTKEEFIIDDAGNLIASLDFSQSPSAQSIYVIYQVNNQAIRRDNTVKEYLDRSYTIQAFGAKVKLYFTNAELQRLINEPNDGIADVGSIGDLQASSLNIFCEDYFSYQTTDLHGQIGNGVYDANSSYIVINGDLIGNVYLHGGNLALNEQCASPQEYPYIGYFEGFNNDNPNLIPSCWWETKFGSGVSFQDNTSNPTIPLFEGSKYLFYNSAVFNASTSTILNVRPVNTSEYSSVDIEFYWYNKNNPSNTSSIEGVQVEYSTDNSVFTTVNFTQRHDASLPAGTGKWKKKRITLPAAAGNQPALYVRFIFFSQHGDNCAMDALSITPTEACSEVTNMGLTSLTGNSATITWTAVPGVTNYDYTILNTANNSTINGTISSTTISRTDLSANTDYFVTVWPLCSPGIRGEEYSIRFTTAPTSCSASNTYFSTLYTASYYTYQWQVDNGSGFVDIADNGIYTGSTTNALRIASPPLSYSGYKYRCWSLISGTRFYLSTTKELKIGATWTGLTNNNWNTATNWSCGAVPIATTDVIIPPGVPNNPNISTITATCKSLTIKPGAILYITPGFKLTITGN